MKTLCLILTLGCLPSVWGDAADSPEPQRNWKAFANGAFIDWQPKEEGLDFCISQVPATGTQVEANVHHIHTHMTPGFKVGVGALLDNAAWDFCFEWTSLDGTYKSFRARESGGLLLSTWFFQTPCENITARWKLDLDLLDFELARYFYSHDRVVLRGLFGVRSAWINQHVNIQSILSDPLDAAAPFKASTEKTGVGPRLGVDARFAIIKWFRFFGVMSGSLLYTKDNVHTAQEDPTVPQLSLCTNTFRSIIPNVEASLGLGLGNLLECGGVKFDIAASYDFMIFWDQNSMRSVIDNLSTAVDGYRGDLYLQGWSLKASLAY